MPKDLRLLGLSLFLWGLGEGLYVYIEPLYLRELGADPIKIGAALSAAALAMALSPIPAGFLADRWGYKPVMLVGWLMGVATAAMMYAAQSLLWFTVGLVAYSFTAFVMPAVYAYTTQSRGAHTIERAITTMSATYAAGTLISPAIGGWIARTFATRSVFAAATVCFMVSTLAIVLVRHLPPDHMPSTARRYAPLMRNRRFLGWLALLVFIAVSMGLGIPFMPNFLADRHALDVSHVGVLGSMASFGWVVLSASLGRRPPRLGLMAAQALQMLALVVLLNGNALGWFALAYFLRGAFSLSRNLAAALVGHVVNPPEMGVAYGMTDTVVALAMMIAPAAAGALYTVDPARPFQVSLAATAVALVLTWRFAPAPIVKSAPLGADTAPTPADRL